MKTSLFRFLSAALLAFGTSSAWGQIGDQTQVPNVPGTNTYGGLLGQPGRPIPKNTNPGAAAGNPTNTTMVPGATTVTNPDGSVTTTNPDGSKNTVVKGGFNPLGAAGTQFAPQGFNGNQQMGNSGFTAADMIRMQMLQSAMGGANRVQYGAPGYDATGQPAGQMPMMPMNQGNAMAPAGKGKNPGNQVMPLFDAQAKREAEKAKAKQRAEDIRAKEAEARERRKTKALEAKKKAEEAKAEEAANAAAN